MFEIMGKRMRRKSETPWRWCRKVDVMLLKRRDRGSVINLIILRCRDWENLIKYVHIKNSDGNILIINVIGPWPAWSPRSSSNWVIKWYHSGKNWINSEWIFFEWKTFFPFHSKRQQNATANMINGYFTRFSEHVEKLLFHFHSHTRVFRRTPSPAYWAFPSSY